MKCNQCQTANKANARFCQNCGAPLPVATEPVDKQPIPARELQIQPGAIVNKKQKVKINLFSVLQSLLLLIIPSLSILFLFLENGVTVKAASDTSIQKNFSFFEILSDMLTGNHVYNVTKASIVMSVSAFIIIFACALFCIICIFSKLLKKNYTSFHALASVFNVLSAAVCAAFLPLAFRFSGMLKLVYTRKANLPAGDIGSVISIWSFVFAAIILVLTIAEIIFFIKANKTEKEAQTNEE